MASEELYDELVDEYQECKTYKETYVEPRWKDIVTLVTPKYGVFAQDIKWADARFDSIGTECSVLLGDGMFGNLCPSSSLWFRYQLATQNKKNKKFDKNLEELTEYMLDVFNRSTFYDVGPEFMQIGNTLTPCMDVREDKADGRIICSIDHPRSTYFKVNSRGKVETVYVRRYFTAEQAAEEYGEENLDDDIKQALKDGSSTEYEFIECTRKRADAKPGSKLASEWAFGEYAFRIGDGKKRFLRESGAKEFPKIVWRWSTRGNEPYAYTPIDDAMPDIRTCNQMVRTFLIAQQKSADPAKFFPKEGRNWSTNPGSRGYYTDPNRKPYTFDDAAGYRADIEMFNMFRERVKQAMKVNHFLMLLQLDQNDMTAREVVERKREGMSVTSSTIGRCETEALDRIHRRFLQIEADAGRLNFLPPELAGAGIKVEYLGPIAQQQKQVYMEQGILGAIDTSIPVFKLWPSSLDKIKSQLLIDHIWEANGAPAESIRDDKEWLKIQEDKAQQAAQAQQAALQQQTASNIDPNVKPEEGSPAQAMVGGTSGRR